MQRTGVGEVPVLCPVHKPIDVLLGRETVQVSPLAFRLVNGKALLADLPASRVLAMASGALVGFDDLEVEVIVVESHLGPRCRARLDPDELPS